MRKLSSMTIVALTVVILFGFGQAFGAMYKAGTYKASAQGKSKKVPVTVEVTVSTSAIKSIKVLSHKESVENEKYGPVVTDALTKVPASIVKANSVDVDAIAKATITSNAVALAVAKALNKAIASPKYKAGTYKAEAMGKSKKVPVTVEVTVSSSAIKSIKVLSHKESVENKKYGPVVTDALTKVPASIVKANSVDVDAIAKATITSNAVALAVAKALEKARK
jgi:uncharacterized protein with FMN-binding domain